ncbi:unnamed protein product, partial [Mesorhabditis belari]|uniref:HRDC domain-containing protein n=1 Tax=Mesorhabditis belari TaxID=2138241 RepID=A0AAF3F965_9BILA
MENALETKGRTICWKTFTGTLRRFARRSSKSTSSIPQIKEESQNRQIFALRELWRWGDTTARNQDESLGYVLHMMIHIAESLPRDMQGILACCSPVPHPLKEHLLLIHRIILEARDRGLEVVETAKKDHHEEDLFLYIDYSHESVYGADE